MKDILAQLSIQVATTSQEKVMGKVNVRVGGEMKASKASAAKKNVSMGGGIIVPGLPAHLASSLRRAETQKKGVSMGGGVIVPGLSAHLASDLRKAEAQKKGVSMGGGYVVPGLAAHIAKHQR